MPTVDDIAAVLERLAPTTLAEEWDNVGLLVGDRAANVERLMTCLTLTPDSTAEAVERMVDLVVTHHPLPFRPVKRLTTDSVEGAMLWRLARAGVAVYSPHTAFDSAAGGINRQLAEGLGLTAIRPLLPTTEQPELGAGRIAEPPAPMKVDQLVAAAKSLLELQTIRVVAQADQSVTRVALACGSGGSFLDSAVDAGCDALVTGEATFHGCLAAQARGVALLLLGHYASERFAVESLANQLARELPTIETWSSTSEHDPIRTL